MRPSIIGATYDLLEFDGRGNFGKFDRSFTKACDLLVLELDELHRRRLRNFTFAHLRNAGYLDVSYASSQTTWSTAPASLVQCADSDFVLIGGSTAAAAVLDAAPRKTLRQIESPDPLFPDTVRVRASLSDVQEIAQRANVLVSPSYQHQFFACLPSIGSIFEKSLVREQGGPLFEPDSTGHFNFSSGEWDRYADPRPFEPGLYRRSFDHAPAVHFVAASSALDRLETFRVTEREWVLVAALALLKMHLPARYERHEQRLSISKAFHRALRLPTLLERSFRSGTLGIPSSGREWFTYGGIAERSVRELTAKLPIFRIEDVP